MPRGDGKGPMGIGPMTGRVAGFCGGYGMPGASNDNMRRGFGMGFGRGGALKRIGGGHGWRNRYFATGLPGWMRSGQDGGPCSNTDPELARQALTARVENLQAELDIMRKHLERLDKSASEAP